MPTYPRLRAQADTVDGTVTYGRKWASDAPRLQQALPALHPSPPTVAYAGPNTATSISNPQVYPLVASQQLPLYTPTSSLLFGGTQVFSGPGANDQAGNPYLSGSAQTGNETSPWWTSYYTDAPIFELTYQGSASPQYRLLVDGMATTPTSATAGLGGNGAQNRALFTFPGGRKFRTITIESGSMFISALTVSKVDTIAPRRPARTIAFMMDSYGINGGASFGIPQVASRIAGSDWVLNASGGTGYNNNQGGTGGKETFIVRLPKLLACNPNYLVTCGGINDSTGTLAADVAAYAAVAKGSLDPSRIYFAGSWSPPGSPGAVKSAIIQAAALAAGCRYIDSGPWLTGTGNTSNLQADGNCDLYIGSDNTHPVQFDGYTYLGTRLGNALVAQIGA